MKKGKETSACTWKGVRRALGILQSAGELFEGGGDRRTQEAGDRNEEGMAFLLPCKEKE